VATWKQFTRGPVLTAPGPSGADMLRAIPEIRRDPMRFLERMWRSHGGVAQFPVPVPPSYLVSTVDGARHVLTTNARAYGKRTIQYSALSLVTGEGLLTVDTQTWRERRRILQPAFHHASIALVAQHVNLAVDRLVAQWSAMDGQIVDVDEAMMHAALDVVGAALFGTDLSPDADRIARSTLQALEVVVARARMPLSAPAWVPTPNNVRLRRAVRDLDYAVAQILKARAEVDPDRPHDMLDMMLAVHRHDAQSLDAQAIRDEIVTFIVAGHETVASALTWAWHLLSGAPETYEKLMNEARGITGPLTIESLEHLPIARAVFEESLRLYPPAWLITRNAREDDVIDGVEIPAGALIILSPWIIHRDPQHWSAPEEFRPSRFIDGEVNRHAYIPFGAGPRLCIGRDMALLEGVLFLAGVARHVKFESIGAEVKSLPLVTIRPAHGLPMRVRVHS
jgi:cytochrome P450